MKSAIGHRDYTLLATRRAHALGCIVIRPPLASEVNVVRPLLLLLSLLVSGSSLAETPSAELRYAKKKVSVLGHQMAYIETGTGRPVVFLHGNPTSSYLWRNVIPHVEPHGRCIAPDLIGMGDSDKLPPTREDGRDGRYRFVEQRRYLEGFLDAIGVNEDIVLVIHDWGSALGFDFARRHPERVAGIVYMESMLREPKWSELVGGGVRFFRAMRSDAGEAQILKKNIFIENVLPQNVMRGLTDEEMGHYRAPYLAAGEDRRPMLTWAREKPFDADPADTHEVLSAVGKWLPQSADVPKLWIDVSEGVLIVGEHRDFAAGFPNQQSVRVQGRHFVQEDSPDEIGHAIAEWLESELQRESR
jgi:haloalkane dehalogenase